MSKIIIHNHSLGVNLESSLIAGIRMLKGVYGSPSGREFNCKFDDLEALCRITVEDNTYTLEVRDL
jgi:hypothetical protein